MLIAAAAAQWNVPGSECAAANGTITHRPSGRTVAFGAVAAAAADIAPPAQVKLKDPKDWKLIGTPAEAFRDGRQGYGQADLRHRRPAAEHALRGDPPVSRCSRARSNRSTRRKLAGIKGVRRVVKLPDAVAVVADSWWQASKAAVMRCR